MVDNPLISFTFALGVFHRTAQVKEVVYMLELGALREPLVLKLM